MITPEARHQLLMEIEHIKPPMEIIRQAISCLPVNAQAAELREIMQVFVWRLAVLETKIAAL